MFLLYTDYPILDKFFELCPFMQTVIPHENHFFSRLIPSPQKSSILTSFLPYQNSPECWDYSDTPVYFTLKR